MHDYVLEPHRTAIRTGEARIRICALAFAAGNSNIMGRRDHTENLSMCLLELTETREIMSRATC